MSALGELLREPAKARNGAETRKPPMRMERAVRSEPLARSSLWEEQIHSLIQRLFLGRSSAPVRRVGFAPIEAQAQTGRLCLDVANALAAECGYEVGLIDAGISGHPLSAELQIRVSAGAPPPWAIAPRLWLAPRESWCEQDIEHPASDKNIERLRELTSEFDFSIVHFSAVSWHTANMAHSCDGVVLVITANQTRRLVAAQIRDQLSKSYVPMLGAVLAERRFPVPEGLYRSL